jgi:hypothetical protein
MHGKNQRAKGHCEASENANRNENAVTKSQQGAVLTPKANWRI